MSAKIDGKTRICDRDCFNCKHPDCINDEFDYRDVLACRQMEKDFLFSIDPGDHKQLNQKKRKAQYGARYRSENKEIIRAKDAVYRETHRDQIKKKNANYEKTHREEKRLRSAVYRDSHREELRAKNRAYKAAHAEELRVKKAEYRRTHHDAILAHNKEYREAHREERRAKDRARYWKKKEEANEQQADKLQAV